MSDSDKTDTLDHARTWFNNLTTNTRNQIVLSIYKLCLGINSTTVSDHINSQWNEKFKKQEEINKQLKEDSKIFSKLEELEKKITNIRASYNELLNIPGSSLTSINNGYIINTSDVIVLISEDEENFKQLSIEYKEKNEIHFAILASYAPCGKTIDAETVYTRSGQLTLLYAKNLREHPERILYAIDAGILLIKKPFHNDHVIGQVNNFIKGIQNVEDSMKERTRHIKESAALLKKDEDHIIGLKQLLTNILSDDGDKTNKDKLVTLCKGLILVHGEKYVTKEMLESVCVDNNIPQRNIRDIGGLKVIKQLATQII